jgi:hypothetical protein
MKRWGLEMSFVTTAPEEVQAAARNLEAIRSMLAQSSASAAAPTAGVVAAAQDEVSAAVAAMFGNFGQEYQVLSAQTQALHEQFVNLLNAGAAAYLNTEVANAEQNLLGAVNGPVRGLLGQSGGATAGASGVAAAASSLTAARSPSLPILGGGVGGLGPILGGTPVGRSISGAVTALQNGSAVSVLSGQMGPGLQTISGNIAGLPAALMGIERSLAPAALQTGASASLAAIEGPYRTLFANTAANLQGLGSGISANPAPFLDQSVINEVGYAQTIATGAQTFIQNLPAELANLPADVQAAIQALLAFNLLPYLQQFVNNQIAYAQIIGTSLQNAAHDFGTGLMPLPAAFQSAFQALQAGNITGAVTGVTQAFTNLFFTGFNVTTVGPNVFVTPTGTIGDLLPKLGIPGQMAQNFTNLLPAGSIPAQISQNFMPLGGIVTALRTYAPEQLALAITPP